MQLDENWQKKAEENQKLFNQWLQKAVVRKAIQRLPTLHERAFEQIDCLSCARCCKGYSPRFKTPDIKRISKVLNLKESRFIEAYLQLDAEGDYVTRSQPCPFLQSDNSCQIYEDRPSDCKRFPYTDEDVFLHRKQLTLKNATFCPIVYLVLTELVGPIPKKADKSRL